MEEQRYLRLYGQGKFDDKLLFSEIERVKRKRQSLEKELNELKDRQRMLRDKDCRIGEVSRIVTQIAEKLDNADYELKQLALEALDVRVILYPDGKIHINGFIPAEDELHCLTLDRFLVY